MRRQLVLFTATRNGGWPRAATEAARAAVKGLPAEPIRRLLQHALADGTSTRELAARTGLERRLIQRLLAGQPRLRYVTADLICQALGVHPLDVWPAALWPPRQGATS